MEHKYDIDTAASSSWMVEIESMLEGANSTVEGAQWSRHSIYRVPQFMKDRTNSGAYSPQFVSLGPLHHGEPHLLPMEEHKRRAVAHMVMRSGRRLQDFVAAIDEVVDELQAAYSELDDKWLGAYKDRFVEVMVTDGCFLLDFWQFLPHDYATNDPIFSQTSYRTLWSTVRGDMTVLENQIPLIVLQRLLAVIGEVWTAREINNMAQIILDIPSFDEGMDKLGLHFLDILHKSYCGTSPQSAGFNKYELRTPCAVELAEAGIQFKKADTKSIQDVDFENGVLSMPLFELYEDTETNFLNMLAFEWLHPDSNLHVASYVCFVNYLIETERDAALLRSQGVIANTFGNDKKPVDMFNTLVRLAWAQDEGSKLGYLNWKINSHCKRRRNKWRAIFMSTYLSNPWVFTSMVAAFILLVAALLQTIYTVLQFYNKD